MTHKLQAILACFAVVLGVAAFLVWDNAWAFESAFWAFCALMGGITAERHEREIHEWQRLHRYMEGRIKELKEWGVQDGEEWKHGGRN